MSLAVHIDQISTPAGVVVVRALAFSVAPGEVLTLMGASGRGKSSVLGAIAGTIGQTADAGVGTGAAGLRFSGSVHLNGVDITHQTTARRGVGLLFQDDLLFAHMTVAENLLFAVPPGARKARLAQVESALADAGLAGFGPRDPATLSGGQRSRVAMMRALLAQPQALLLDEPFSRLDADLRGQFRAFVFAQIRARHIPAVLVTHDAADIADPARVTVLQAALQHTAHHVR